MQFFMHEGQWKTREQIRSIRLRLNMLCKFCDTKNPHVHKKECPLRKKKIEKPKEEIIEQEIN